MTLERDKLGRFIKGGTKNPKSYIWKKGKKQHKRAYKKGLTKENDDSILNQSKTLSKTWKKQLKEGRTTTFKKGYTYWKGKHRSEETKKKLRLAKIKQIEKCLAENTPISPTIGKNETLLLDEIEKSNQIKIIRQFSIDGYFVDGYNKKYNIVFEIDEKPKIKDKDKKREKYIKNKLKCQFIRVKDYE